MSTATPSTRGYLVRIALAIGLFCLMNGLWSWPGFGLYDLFPPSLAVYLVTSLVAVILLWQAARGGWLTRREAGLDVSGWTAPKRLLGLALVLFMALGGYHTLQPPAPPVEAAAATGDAGPEAEGSVPTQPLPSKPVPPKPSVGSYCFWFVYLLSASLTELLVFISIGYCMLDRALRQRGVRPLRAGLIAAVFASVAFGLYHFTHPPRFWNYVFLPLMPVMLIDIAYFAVTRNFWITLILHNAFASVGFVQEQWAERYKENPDPSMVVENFLQSTDMTMIWVLSAFAIPFLIMHWIEARSFRDTDTVSSRS